MVEIYKTTFKLRRGLEKDWNKNNPILADGEPGFVLDKNILKIGDGVTHWIDLKPINKETISILKSFFYLLVDVLEAALYGSDQSDKIKNLKDMISVLDMSGGVEEPQLNKLDTSQIYLQELEKLTTPKLTLFKPVETYCVGDELFCKDMSGFDVYGFHIAAYDEDKNYISSTRTARISAVPGEGYMIYDPNDSINSRLYDLISEPGTYYIYAAAISEYEREYIGLIDFKDFVEQNMENMTPAIYTVQSQLNQPTISLRQAPSLKIEEEYITWDQVGEANSYTVDAFGKDRIYSSKTYYYETNERQIKLTTVLEPFVTNSEVRIKVSASNKTDDSSLFIGSSDYVYVTKV